MWAPVIIGLLLQQVKGLQNSTEGCPSEPSCLKCGPQGCVRCPDLIVDPSRRCVTECPFGHRLKWSTKTDFVGRICVHNGNFLGLSSGTLAVLTGILTGTVLCVAIVTTAVIYLRYKRQKMSPNRNSGDSASDLDDSPERRDFLKQLETLRPYAQSYLDMLNDTRRQLRELHREGGDNSAIAAYKPVVRDLAKILLLLNRKPDRIGVPDDWEHLFSWAEKALKRYKRMSDVSQPQVAQLISFLQGANSLSSHELEMRGSTTMSTFKPDQVFGSSLSLQNAAIKSFDANYETALPVPINPQWKFDCSLSSGNNATSEFNPALWKNSKEYLNTTLFLDDDYWQLGYRPQDEITTEL